MAAEKDILNYVQKMKKKNAPHKMSKYFFYKFSKL